MPDEGNGPGQEGITLHKGLQVEAWIDLLFFVGREAEIDAQDAQQQGIGNSVYPFEGGGQKEDDGCCEKRPFDYEGGLSDADGNGKGLFSHDEVALKLQYVEKG